MRTFIVPALEGENMPNYQMRVSSMAWQFNADRELCICKLGEAMIDGDQPEGAGFVEVTE